MITFTIPGDPVSWMVQQKRLGKFTSPVTHDRTIAWQARVASIATAAMVGIPRFEGPVSLRVRFCFEWPQSKHRKRNPRLREAKPTKPDLTNLTKALEDALTGVVYRDDAQVCEHATAKELVYQGDPARTEVEIREMP